MGVKLFAQVLKEFPWSLAKVEVILVELEHAGKVFPGTRFYPNNLGSKINPR